MPGQGPELRDVHVPYVSAWWPLAPGWWVLLTLIVIAVGVGVWRLRRRAAWQRYLAHTLADLHAARDNYATDGNAAAFAATASNLLRRVARTRDPRSVTLQGDAWRDALAALAPGRDVQRLAALEQAMYRPAAALDVPATARDVEAWVKAALTRRSAHGMA